MSTSLPGRGRLFAAASTTLRGRGLRNDTRQFDVAPPGWPEGSAVPTQVMHGDLDDIVPVSHAHDYATAIPGACTTAPPSG